MIFRLPLAPPETLGRRFQYAFLSLEPEIVTLNLEAGYAEFASPSDYVDLVDKAVQRLSTLLLPSRQKGCNGVTIRGIDCCRLHRGPTLYLAGKKYGKARQGDAGLLAYLGFTSCPAPGKKGAGVAWNHAALSYADMVLSRGEPLGGSAPDLPWLAKATLFSKARAAGGDVATRMSTLTLDTVGSVLLGGAISFAGSYRLAGKKRGELTEFYLIPDTVTSAYARLRDLMLSKGLTGNVIAQAIRIVNELPVSTEIAIALTLAVELATQYGSASQLSRARLTEVEELEKAALLVTVNPQQRPMVTAATPLTMILYFTYRDTTLRQLISLARQARQYSNEVEGLDALAANCVNAAYMQASYPCGADHIAHCIRGLEAAAQALERKGLSDPASLANSLTRNLATDYLAMIRRSCT